MSKLRQRQRKRHRLRAPMPRSPRPAPPPSPPGLTLPGMTPDEVWSGGTLLGQDLHQAALKAQARATGGYAPASVMGHFLAPLKYVYQVMDAFSTAALAQAPPHLTPACTPGCFACCRLYVEVGPWEAFGIADYVTQVCETGQIARDTVLTHLREEVTRFVTSGSDKGAPRLCSFLGRDGCCGIYPARPSACRSYYSVSRAACEHYFGQATLDDEAPGRVVRMADHAITAQLSVAEMHATAQPPLPPVEMAPLYEMQSAVLRILETPQALVRYLHGEDIFAGCVRHTAETELRAASQRLVQLQVPGPGKEHR